MRHQVSLLLAGLTLAAMLAVSLAFLGENSNLLADDAAEQAFVPLALKPLPTPTPLPSPTPSPTPTAEPTLTPTPSPTPDPDNPLRNPSFENPNWSDLDSIKQQPADWTLTFVQPGQPLYDSPDPATGSCECVHKWDWQLPSHERPGGEDPLILGNGELTFKIFSGQAFGTQLSQTLFLEPGSRWTLTVPLRVHLYGDVDPYAAESSVWVNNEGAWALGTEMGNRKWCKHVNTFTVPADGRVQIDIRVKNKYPNVKDFFIDELSLLPEHKVDPHGDMKMCVPNATMTTYEPYSSAE